MNLLSSEEKKVFRALKNYAPKMEVPWVAENTYGVLLQAKK
jgi:hypothetical protein